MTSVLSMVWGSLVEIVLRRSAYARAKFFVAKIVPFLEPGWRLIDIGCGTGHIATVLKQRGHTVEMMNVRPGWRSLAEWLLAIPCSRELAKTHNLPLYFYEGTRLPCGDRSRDAALLAFVMHHADDPEAVLAETVRVARKRVIVFEDVPKDKREAWLNRLADALVNLEIGHPHHNRSLAEWHATFDRLGLRLIHEESFVSSLLGLPFPNTLFVLEVPASER